MARVKRAVHSKKHRRATLERAKGYYGNKSRSYRAANEQVQHSLQYAITLHQIMPQRRACMNKDQREQRKVQREMHRLERRRQRVILGDEVGKRDETEIDHLDARRRAEQPA